MMHLFRLSVALLSAALLLAVPTAGQAAGGLNIQTITWDSIGVKSSTTGINDGPGSFPVGVKVCNTSSSSVSGLKTNFAWDSSNSLINLDGPASDTIGTLAAGSCADSYYAVQASKSSSAWETTRKYHITATADGGLSVSTALGRQFYVEKLQSTTKNSISKIAGPGGCNANYTSCDPAPSDMQVGKSYTFKLYSNSATSNDQLSASLTFPGGLFRIQKIRSEYQTPAGAIIEGPYADACGWQSRACAGPVMDPFKPNGKAGGIVTTTYTVTPIAAGSGDLRGLMTNVYSGNFYYNSDYSDAKLFSRYTIRYPLDVRVDGQGQVISDTGGIKCGLGAMVCNAGYDSGTLVTLKAAPDQGQEFKGWLGDGCSGATTTCQVAMDKARSVTAQFAGKTQFPLSVKIGGQGTVVSSISGIACNPDGTPSCSAQFDQGVSVELTPIAITGWRFAGWTGAGCSGTSSCFVRMDQAKDVQATFELIPPDVFKITIDPSPKGGSVVSKSKPDNKLQINCGQICTSNYPFDTSLELTPVADAGYQFVKWSGCDQSGDFITIDQVCQMTVTGNRTVAAVFEALPRYDLNAEIVGQGSISSQPVGIDCQDKCSSSFQQGTLVTLTPRAAADWQFDRWQGDCSGQGECRVKTDKNLSVQAVFVPINHKLQVDVLGQGSVQSAPAGIDCGLQCQAEYQQGSAVRLEAIAQDGWRIVGWSGDCQGNTNICLLDMSQSRSASVKFEKIPSYQVNLGVTGSGSIKGLGLDCPGQCNAGFLEGTPLELTAVAEPEWQFKEWQGDCSGTDTCKLQAMQDHKVRAVFVPVRYKLQIDNSGHGTVSGNGIDCGASCQAEYDSGSKVILSAKADDGYRFRGWSKPCEQQQDCSIDMTQDTVIKADFEKIPDYQLSVTTKGSGIVRDNVGSIDCPDRCLADYQQDTLVRLEAAPKPEWRFKEWQGACTGSGECQVTISQKDSVEAVFVPVQYQLSAKIIGEGKLISTPEGLGCSTECTASYDSGTAVRLVALAGPEQKFTGWSGDGCSGTYPVCNLKSNRSRTIAAQFQPIPKYPLQIRVEGYGTVRSRFGTITCPATCSSDVLENTQVWLEVVVPPGQKFAGWDGDCQGTERICIVPMKAARNVAARFETVPPIMHRLDVKPSSGGDVRTDLGDIGCGLLCSNQYAQNSIVKLKAYPQPGYRLKGWSESCQVIMFICAVKMDQAKQVQAQFEKIPPHTLQVVVVGRGWGRVTSKAADLDCTSSCRKTLDSSLTIELSQQAKPGYQFLQWSGACQGPGVCRVSMTNLRTVYAVYRKA